MSAQHEQQQQTTEQRQPGLIGRLYARFAGLVHELGKFGVVGGVAFVVDTGLYWLLLEGGMNTFAAKTIAVIVAATVAFAGNRFWTWRDRPKSGLHREYVLYFVFNAIGLGIALGCLWISHSLLGSFWPEIFHTKLADLVAAQGFGLVLGTLFRFYSYRRWVFA
ncbi:GtrA family protein [Longispora albida]|uniref:GtrA family protein n=1 Tax=Longispora albida TaxID=203523 RepID=UPI000378B292|nr:GtrA family protein [Longispora albida]